MNYIVYYQSTSCLTCWHHYGNQCALKTVAIHPDLLHHTILLVGCLNLLSSDVLPCKSTKLELPVQLLQVITVDFDASPMQHDLVPVYPSQTYFAGVSSIASTCVAPAAHAINRHCVQ